MSALLITGANGFIGSAVLRALRTQPSAQPIILAGRNCEALAARCGCRNLRLDLSTADIELPSGIGSVLHLAGEKRDASRMEAVNHMGAARLVEAAARAGATRLVHLSSVGVYGARKHAGVLDEAWAHAPQNAYERSKSAGELVVRERCAALGLSCVILQPSNVVGVVPGRSYPLLGLARMVVRGWFRHLGHGDAWVNYVAVEDVAAALAAATLSDTAKGVFIVNTPAPLRSLVGWMADELGVPAPAKHLPLWLGATAAAAAALGRVVLRRELPFSPERFRELTNTTQYDGRAVTQALRFTYSVGIEHALRSMMRQYRREGLV